MHRTLSLGTVALAALTLLSPSLHAQEVPGQVPETPAGVNPDPNLMKEPVDWTKVQVYRIIGGGRVPDGVYKPLTQKERRILWAADTFASDGAYIRPFLLNIPNQISSYPAGWDGFEGYMQRAGTAFAAYGIANTTESGLQAMMHHEPRYVPCQCSGFGRRALHALAYSFITVNDQGHKVLNISPYIGAYTGALAVQSFYPGNYDVWHAMRTGNSQFYYGWIFNEVREFAPDLARTILFRKKQPKAPEPPPAPANPAAPAH